MRPIPIDTTQRHQVKDSMSSNKKAAAFSKNYQTTEVTSPSVQIEMSGSVSVKAAIVGSSSGAKAASAEHNNGVRSASSKVQDKSLLQAGSMSKSRVGSSGKTTNLLAAAQRFMPNPTTTAKSKIGSSTLSQV